MKFKESILQLRKTSARLNEFTDLANSTIGTLEKFLNEICSIGLPVSVDAWEDDRTRLRLAYARIGGKFRIAIIEEKKSADDLPVDSHKPHWQEVDTRAWSEAPRGDKSRAFPAL